MFKLTADITPLEALDVSFEYAYKLDDYNSTILGMQKAEENEFIVDGNYVWKGMKFFAFFDYDFSYTDQTQRTGTTDPSGPAPPHLQTITGMPTCTTTTMPTAQGQPSPSSRTSSPSASSTTSSRTTAPQTSRPRASLSPANQGINNGNIDIGPWDDYTRQNISARLMYDYNKNLGLVFGYLYSQFRLNDGQLNGYQYVAPGPTYLTGAYTDGSYKANVYYLRAVYRF